MMAFNYVGVYATRSGKRFGNNMSTEQWLILLGFVAFFSALGGLKLQQIIEHFSDGDVCSICMCYQDVGSPCCICNCHRITVNDA